jgi:tetratricopeptide (TPR) repeat protein
MTTRFSPRLPPPESRALSDVRDILEVLRQAEQAVSEIPSALDQSHMVGQLAEAYKEAGDRSAAMTTLSRTLIRARTLTGPPRIWAFTRIATAQAKMGDKEAARATLQEALLYQNPSSLQPGDANQIAGTFAEIGDVQGAFSVVDALRKLPARDLALFAIAGTQANTGQVAAALQTADLIEDESQQTAIRTSIAVAQAIAQVKAGHIQEAGETVSALKNQPLARVDILVAMAEARDKAGDHAEASKAIDQARQAVSLITPDHARDFALGRIVVALTRMDDLAGALKITEVAIDRDSQQILLESIVKTQIGMGDIKGALETADILDKKDRRHALISIGTAQARAGDIAGALQTAEATPYGTAIFGEVAVAQSKSGNWSAALATFERGRIIGKANADHPELEYSSEIIMDMAKAQAARGNFDAVYRWAITQERPIDRAVALIAVAKGILESQRS